MIKICKYMYLHLSIFHFYHFVIVKIQTHFWPFSSDQKLWKSSYGIIKKLGEKKAKNHETVRYYELFDHTSSDQNYSKVCKLRTYNTSPLYFYFYLLAFQFSTVQWLNCTNLKDDLNCSYNGGGVMMSGWSQQLALSIIRTYDWSVSRICHSFKFVQNCSKIFW